MAAWVAASRLDHVWEGRIEENLQRIPDNWYARVQLAALAPHPTAPLRNINCHVCLSWSGMMLC